MVACRTKTGKNVWALMFKYPILNNTKLNRNRDGEKIFVWLAIMPKNFIGDWTNLTNVHVFYKYV